MRTLDDLPATFHVLADAGAGDVVVGTRFPSRAAGERPVFVLVHGLGVSTWYWRPLIDALREHGEVWSLDLPGFGATPSPRRSPSLADHADAVVAFTRRLGIRHPVLVGHSMGCQVITELAVRHPVQAARLALLGPTADAAARTLPQHAARLAHEMVIAPWSVKASVTTDYLVRSNPVFFLRQLPNLLDDAIEQRMPRLTQPVLVVRGADDPIVPRDWSTSLAALAPEGAHAEVPGTHVIMHSAPLRVAALLADLAA